MRYHEPYGASDPNAGYINGDPSIGRPGSIPPAAQMELPQREIVNAIISSGQTPSDSDLFQLWKAMQRAGGTRYAEDTGTTNDVVIAPAPSLSEYAAGIPLLVLVAESNTGATTINVSGLGAKSVVRKGGAALLANDIVAGSIAFLVYDGDRFQLMNYAGGGGGGGGIIGGENIGDAPGEIFAGLSGDDTLWFRTIEEGGGIKIETVGNEVVVSMGPIGSEVSDIDFVDQKLVLSDDDSLSSAIPIDVRTAFARALFGMGISAVVFSTTTPSVSDRTAIWFNPNNREVRRYNSLLGNWFVLTPSQHALHLAQQIFTNGTVDTLLETGDLFAFYDFSLKETKLISKDNLAKQLPSWNWSKVSSNTLAVDRGAYLCDTSGATFTLTLPAAPADQTAIRIADAADFELKNLIVARNGSTISGLAQNMNVDLALASFELVAFNGDWRIA